MERMRRVATLLSDPRTPALPRAAVILALLYLVSPVDLIPEALFGVVGYLDDILMVWLAVRWLVKAGPASPQTLARP